MRHHTERHTRRDRFSSSESCEARLPAFFAQRPRLVSNTWGAARRAWGGRGGGWVSCSDVYVLGGRGPQRTKRNDVWRLDTAQWRWSELRCDGATSVVPRDFAAAVTLDYDHVLLHGGHTGLKVTPHAHPPVPANPKPECTCYCERRLGKSGTCVRPTFPVAESSTAHSVEQKSRVHVCSTE
jgi:hypothetical protein